MILTIGLNLKLPLENPVLIFSLILFIILFAPILLNKFKIPSLIGLIIAGAIIGPNGLNLMLRDSSIILFGTVGLLYIMFLAGLEIDLADFRKNSRKSFVFGMYTFIIPMILGTTISIYFLGYSVPTSVLLASMFASHTLIAYPIISTLGVTKNRAVNITVGGTMITDTLALLVLAVIAGMATGEVNNTFWIRLSISILIFGVLVLGVFPIISRWFFKRYDNNISQYIFVLAIVFMSAFLAEAAGIEAIIGAFLAGLALNRLIPRTSPLMNRIEFVGNALFIPLFLIGVGMLIDFKIFFKDFETIKVAITMTVVATAAKFIAAWLTQKTFNFSIDERRIIFGLSNAQAAATLAAVLVGYNIIIGETSSGEPIRLLSENVLNGTILMILVTCTIASFVAQKGAQNLAMLEKIQDDEPEEREERILIPLSNIENVAELIHLGVTVQTLHQKQSIYALNIIAEDSSDETSEKNARKILDKAVSVAAATDNLVHPLIRYDMNIVDGITNVVKEHKITNLIIGLHEKKNISDSFLGNLTEGILSRCDVTTMIYKSKQPLATVKRNVVIVPEKAEYEVGFPFWLVKIWNMGKNTGAKLVFYASEATTNYMKEIYKQNPVDAEFNVFSDWDDFLILLREVKPDDNLIVVLSRRMHISYHNYMAKVPSYLNRYFTSNNFIIIFPVQVGVSDHVSGQYDFSMLDPFNENMEHMVDIKRLVNKLFRK